MRSKKLLKKINAKNNQVLSKTIGREINHEKLFQIYAQISEKLSKIANTFEIGNHLLFFY